jgi:hypothetical protein
MREVTIVEFRSDKFANAWRDLEERVPLHDLGQTYAWTRSWWDAYENHGPARKELFLLADEESGQISALWPCFIRHRHGLRVIHWLGHCDGMTTDYCGPLVLKTFEDHGYHAFIKALAEKADRWDVAVLSSPPWGDVHTRILKATRLHDSTPVIYKESRITGHLMEISLRQGIDAVLARMGKKTRADVRSYLRAAGQTGATLTFFWGRTIASRLYVLYELNSSRWEVFRDKKNCEFMDKMIQAQGVEQSKVFLGLLVLRERAIASVLGYIAAGRCFLHSAGILRESINKMSPGMTLYSLLFQRLAEMGVHTVDLSPGTEEYKSRMGATPVPINTLFLWTSRKHIYSWRLLNWVRRNKGLLIRMFARKGQMFQPKQSQTLGIIKEYE